MAGASEVISINGFPLCSSFPCARECVSPAHWLQRGLVRRRPAPRWSETRADERLINGTLVMKTHNQTSTSTHTRRLIYCEPERGREREMRTPTGGEGERRASAWRGRPRCPHTFVEAVEESLYSAARAGPGLRSSCGRKREPALRRESERANGYEWRESFIPTHT